MSRSLVNHGSAVVARGVRALTVTILAGFILNYTGEVQAQSWTGSVSNLWSDPGNWTPNTVPNSSSANVTITGGVNNPVQLNTSPTIGNLTVGASNTLDLSGGYLYVAGGSVANSGQINLGSSSGAATVYAYVNAGSPLTVSGTGAITLNNASSYLEGYYGTSSNVLNESTINGQGYIYNIGLGNLATVSANASGGTLYIYDAAVTNSGTLQAVGGGSLYIYNSTISSSGGTISTDGASSVVIDDSTINGGNLTSSGGGVIHGIDGNSLNGVTITNGSIFSLDANNSNYVAGSLTNNGTVLIGGSGGGGTLHVDSDTVTLSGTGTLTLNNANSYIQGYLLSSNTLVNQSTINGYGYIYSVDLNNQGTVDANVAGKTLSIYDAPTTNNGVLRVDPGATLDLTASTLTNFVNSGGDAGDLKGGTYQIFSGTLSFNNGSYQSDILTNSATILLDGAAGTPKFLDQNGNSALANFQLNATTGSFTIQNGVNLTTTAGDSTVFQNFGQFTIGANSSFTVGGSNDYAQRAGTTTLAASSSVLANASNLPVIESGGTIRGFGTIQGNLAVVGGVLMPGVAGTAGVLTVTGNYSEVSYATTAELAIQIGGPDALHGLAQLDVGGTATLNGGLLDLSLINGFKPYNGEVFEILSSNGLSGSFSDNVIELANITFSVEYSPSGYANDVVLVAQVSSVPEPATWLLLGIGLAGAGTFVRRSARARASA